MASHSVLMHAANTPSPAGVAAASVAPTSTSGAAAAKVRRGLVNNFKEDFLALVASHEAKAGLTTEEMSAAFTSSAKSDTMVAGALKNLHAKTVEHKVCVALANLVCKNRRNMTNDDRAATRTIETAIVSGSATHCQVATVMSNIADPKGMSFRNLRPKLAIAKERAAGQVQTWGTQKSKKRFDSMVDNEVVIKLVEEAWREKAVTPADRKYEGVSQPGRKMYYGRVVAGKTFKPKAASGSHVEPVQVRKILLTVKTAKEVAHTISNDAAKMKAISDAIHRTVTSIGQRTVALLRPWDVRTLRPVHRLTCVCLGHTQGRNMYARFRNELSKVHSGCKCACIVCRPSGESVCVAMDRWPPLVSEYICRSCCPKQRVDFGMGGEFAVDLHKMDCITRDCNECPKPVALAPCEANYKGPPLHLRMFEQRMETKKKKKGEDVAKEQKAWRIRTGSYPGIGELKEALDTLIDDPKCKDNSGFDSFRMHQWKVRFLDATEPVLFANMGDTDLFVEIDYAMALSLESLEDLQQQFMNGDVVTCVTCVVKYLQDGKLVKEEIAFVSDQRSQDSTMTECVTRKLVEIFKNRGRNMKNIIFKSDNCKVQFKSAENYNDMFKWTHQKVQLFDGSIAFVATMVRCFGVAMHGKCECDSLGALIGNVVRKARLSGQAVADTAAQIVNLFNERASQPSGYMSASTKFARLTVVEVTRAEYATVKAEREGDSFSMRGGQQSNQFHQVVASIHLKKPEHRPAMTANTPAAAVFSREHVFCGCGGCRSYLGMDGEQPQPESKCAVAEYTREWKEAEIQSPLKFTEEEFIAPPGATAGSTVTVSSSTGVEQSVKLPKGVTPGQKLTMKVTEVAPSEQQEGGGLEYFEFTSHYEFSKSLDVAIGLLDVHDDEESGIGNIPGLSYKLARIEKEAYAYKCAVAGGEGGDDDSDEEVTRPFKDGDIVIDVFFYECRPDCHPFDSGLRLDDSRAITILRDVITMVTSVVEHGICEWGGESYSVDPEEHACVQVALNLDGDA